MFFPDHSSQDSLERRYDGPIPPADPAACRAVPRLRARLFDRLAAETVTQSAIIRRRTPAHVAPQDPRLGRLGTTLATCRAHGVAWLDVLGTT